MSLSYVPLKPILVTDPITDVRSVDKYAVLQGGSKVTYKSFTSTSISNSSIQFSCPPPSANVIVNRQIKCTIPIRLQMAGLITTTDLGYVPPTSLLNPGRDAPRQFPLNNSLESLQINLNNDSVSIPMADVLSPLTRYDIDSELRTREYSSSPCYPDCSFNYSDLVGTNLNPLGNYGNSLVGTSIPRGGFPFTIVAGTNVAVVPTLAGALATATVDMWITESLFLSPLFWGKASYNSQGFYNITSMDFNLSFLAAAGMRMWSHCPLVSTSGAIQVRSNITSIIASFNSFTSPGFSYAQNFPQLLFEYITPNILTKEVLGPNIPVTYPYHNVTRYVSDLGAISSANPPSPYMSNTIQLSTIPRQMYIFARPNNQSLQSRCDLTDTFLTISNIAIQYANQNTLLSSATQVQLFDMNTKNGGSQNWLEWSGLGLNNSLFPPTAGNAKIGGTGSVLCLRFGDQIQLEDGEAAGMGGSNYQLQVQVTLKNSNLSGEWDNVPMALYIVVVSEGTFTVTQLGSCQHQEGVLSRHDVLDAQTQPGINMRSLDRVAGGDFLSTIGNFASKVNDFLKEYKVISTLAPNFGPIGNVIGTVARQVGYGEQGGQAIQGGAKISKKDLRSRFQ